MRETERETAFTHIRSYRRVSTTNQSHGSKKKKKAKPNRENPKKLQVLEALPKRGRNKDPTLNPKTKVGKNSLPT